MIGFTEPPKDPVEVIEKIIEIMIHNWNLKPDPIRVKFLEKTLSVIKSEKLNGRPFEEQFQWVDHYLAKEAEVWKNRTDENSNIYVDCLLTVKYNIQALPQVPLDFYAAR